MLACAMVAGIFAYQKFFHAAKQTVSARKEIQVTRIEGWRSGLRDPITDDERAAYPFLAHLPRQRTLEGYLFPDTYRVWEDAMPAGLIKKQLDAFAWRFASSTIEPDLAPLKTLDDVVILASIIEREVPDTDDRRIVAGIFLNRLRDGMALQSDATITFVTGSTGTRTTAKELAIRSPYNTYAHAGLPPGPVCNPGSIAIESVLHPKHTAYRYFLTDRAGKVLYAKTFAEHKRNRLRAGY